MNQLLYYGTLEVVVILPSIIIILLLLRGSNGAKTLVIFCQL